MVCPAVATAPPEIEKSRRAGSLTENTSIAVTASFLSRDDASSMTSPVDLVGRAYNRAEGFERVVERRRIRIPGRLPFQLDPSLIVAAREEGQDGLDRHNAGPGDQRGKLG